MKALICLSLAFLCLTFSACGADRIQVARKALVTVKSAVDVAQSAAGDAFERKFQGRQELTLEEALPWMVLSEALVNSEANILVVQAALDVVETGGHKEALYAAVAELIRSMEQVQKSLKECGIKEPPVFREAMLLIRQAKELLP